MSVFAEIRERRLFQIVAAFAAAGWIGLEIVGSFIERGLLPEIAYRIGLGWYIAGILGSLIIGWYHGEKGRQKASIPEVVMLAGLTLTAVVFTGFVVVDHVRQEAITEARKVGFDLSRVAVLYFDEASGTETERYLADAMTESLITQLRSVEGLQVASSNAVLPYRDSDADGATVGRALEVGTVVDGTVREEGGQVRIDLRLLDGNTGYVLARADVERDADQIIEAVDETAEEAARLLREILGEEIRLRTIASGTPNVGAWRAVQLAEKLRKDALELPPDDTTATAVYRRADSLLAVAETRSSDWPEPMILRARIALDRAQRAGEARTRAARVGAGIAHANRALAIAPDDARALAARGSLRLFAYLAHLPGSAAERQETLRGARSDLERAVRLDRDLAWAQAALSILYYQPGISDLPAAALAARQAYEADAYLAMADDVLERLFWTNLDMGQFAQARRWCAEGARRFPEDPRFQRCRLWQATSPGSDPDVDRAWEIRDRVLELVTEERAGREDIRARMLIAGVLGRAAEAAGEPHRRQLLADSARSVLRRASREYARLDDPHRELKGVEAFVWVILDDLDRAIDSWKVYAALNHGFQETGDISWRWRELREHPRFQEITTRESTH